jgi:tRNA pseudouridine(55) synthase
VSSPLWDRKVYWADVFFGFSTVTDDADGRVLATGDGKQVELTAIMDRLLGFVGVIEQRPPAYSAVHVAPGRRAYQQARQATARDAQAQIPLGLRSVRVDGIAIVGWRPPVVSLLVQCGSGTYIRSLARDLGSAVGCPAHLAALVRLRVGPFAIADAVDLRALEAVAEHEAWDRVVWPIDGLGLGADGVLIVPPARGEDFIQGRSWQGRSSSHSETDPSETDLGRIARSYLEDGRFLGFVRHDEHRWFPATRPSRWLVDPNLDAGMSRKSTEDNALPGSGA